MHGNPSNGVQPKDEGDHPILPAIHPWWQKPMNRVQQSNAEVNADYLGYRAV